MQQRAINCIQLSTMDKASEQLNRVIGYYKASRSRDIEVESSFGFTLIFERVSPCFLNLDQSFLTFFNNGIPAGLATFKALARLGPARQLCLKADIRAGQ